MYHLALILSGSKIRCKLERSLTFSHLIAMYCLLLLLEHAKDLNDFHSKHWNNDFYID